jgi:hypothetical protein
MWLVVLLTSMVARVAYFTHNPVAFMVFICRNYRIYYVAYNSR